MCHRRSDALRWTGWPRTQLESDDRCGPAQHGRRPPDRKRRGHTRRPWRSRPHRNPPRCPRDIPVHCCVGARSDGHDHRRVTIKARSRNRNPELSTGEPAYAASGGRVEYSGAGTICSLSAPFTIPGNTVTFTFTPSSKSGGTWKASGGLMDLVFVGDGSYSVVTSDDNVPTLLVLEGTVATIAPGGDQIPRFGRLSSSHSHRRRPAGNAPSIHGANVHTSDISDFVHDQARSAACASLRVRRQRDTTTCRTLVQFARSRPSWAPQLS